MDADCVAVVVCVVPFGRLVWFVVECVCYSHVSVCVA